MVRERLDDFWIYEQMYPAFENEPQLSDREIAARMKKIGEELGRNDYPAQRTVNKYRREYPGLPENVRAGYRLFHWPESMQNNLLPWEASAAVLEMLGYMDAKGMSRPTIRLASWYWRLTLAAPEINQEIRLNMALHISSHESAGRDITPGLEWALAYAPWKEEKQWPKAARFAAYKQALTRNNCPIPKMDRLPVVAVPGRDGADLGYWFEAMAAASLRREKQKEEHHNG